MCVVDLISGPRAAAIVRHVLDERPEVRDALLRPHPVPAPRAAVAAESRDAESPPLIW